jgi:ABC-type dipeptide/oligopeptide/nickel transport system ATPase component
VSEGEAVPPTAATAVEPAASPTRTAGAVLLEAQGLRVEYAVDPAPIAAVRTFDLVIREREVVGLVGESGSGKSTAAMALLGLVRPPGRVVAGTVRLRGADILGRSDAQLRSIRGREVGLITQDARGALNPLIRVGDQIANVIRAHADVDKRTAQRRAVEALRVVGIPDPERRIRAYPHELSGGMAQRVLIAIATIHDPVLLIADEPTTGLDVTVQAQFLDTLQRRVQDTGSAVLFVTHDLGIVAQYCDRVAVMLQGEIVEQADVRTIFGSPSHPDTRELVGLARDREQPVRARPTTRATSASVVRDGVRGAPRPGQLASTES